MLRPFNEHLSNAFAGANPLRDGSAPRYGETDRWTVIVSGRDAGTLVQVADVDGNVWQRRFDGSNSDAYALELATVVMVRDPVRLMLEAVLGFVLILEA